MEAWRHGGMEAWRHGGMDAWMHGCMDAVDMCTNAFTPEEAPQATWAPTAPPAPTATPAPTTTLAPTAPPAPTAPQMYQTSQAPQAPQVPVAEREEAPTAPPPTQAPVTASGGKLIKGISYSPVPLKKVGSMQESDFMSPGFSAMWGPGCRRDLSVISALGANAMRTYGDNVANDHSDFLREAQINGLEVIPAISDWPYKKMPGSCQTTGFHCRDQVHRHYAEMLRKGFGTAGGAYHPAIRMVVVVNEPETTLSESQDDWLLAVVSAIDGILSAEKDRESAAFKKCRRKVP